jgi:SNF2 family DNA or RNA helicase
MIEEIKMRAGKYMRPVTVRYEDGRIYFKHKFNRTLMAEWKNMAGAKYHGYDPVPKKIWSVLDCPRNQFQIEYLRGNNPYKRFDEDIQPEEFERPLYAHQCDMVEFGLARRHCILAAEMGTGKSLAIIEIMERSGLTNWWWIGPKSAIRSVEMELIKWESKITPLLITYDSLREMVKKWESGTPAPQGVVYDESSRIKNPTAQRSQAAMHVADAVRNEFGYNGYIIEMSGSPAPKSPADWWHQCEVACPGYLKEGHIDKFKKRLALVVERESVTGGIYPHLVTWRSDANKCNKCGELKDHESHDPLSIGMLEDAHTFEASEDEVSFLYERMRGLVLVRLKKDCLDLPDKIYRVINCKPTGSTLRAAKLIAKKSTSTIKALTLLRELSDGFQYVETEVGKQDCDVCHGEKTVLGFTDEQGNFFHEKGQTNWKETRVACPPCKGTGVVAKTEREAKQVPCPKEDAIIDLLDEHDEIGRIIIYAGFTGSIDRIVETCLQAGWAVLKVDGRGWVCTDENNNIIDWKDGLKAFDLTHPDRDQYLEKYPRIAFVGHPQSGGMGLTLTASPSIVYYSNDFNAESRIQSEDRIHRMGMDENKGATIIDLYHLPSDEYVATNLMNKRKLQSQSLGDIQKLYE